MDDLKLVLVRNVETLAKVWELVCERFEDQGYLAHGVVQSYHPQLDMASASELYPLTKVYIVVDKQSQIVGTISVTLDGPCGLHVDSAFRRSLGTLSESLRPLRGTLGAVWRIATREASMMVMAMLIDAAYWTQDCDVLLFEFHPAHVRFYQQHVGLHIISQVKEEPDVGKSPAVLMRWDKVGNAVTWEKTRKRFFSGQPQIAEEGRDIVFESHWRNR